MSNSKFPIRRKFYPLPFFLAQMNCLPSAVVLKYLLTLKYIVSCYVYTCVLHTTAEVCLWKKHCCVYCNE